MKILKLFLTFGIFLLILSLSGCTSSLNGKVDITNKRLEAGETTNMYITITYTKNIFSGKPQNITLEFLSGEGLEVVKDTQVITSDTIENLEGSITKLYTVRAKNIKAQQITDSITIRISSSDGKTIGMISDLVTVTPRRLK